MLISGFRSSFVYVQNAWWSSALPLRTYQDTPSTVEVRLNVDIGGCGGPGLSSERRSIPGEAGAVDPEGAFTPCTALHPALKRTGAKLGKAKQKRSLGRAENSKVEAVVPQEHSQTIRCCVFSTPCGTLVSYKYSTRDGATACLCACRDRFRSGILAG